MAFKKETLKQIATLLKIKPEDVEKVATEKDEMDLAIPEGLTVLTPEEVTTLKTNEYNTGKTKGVEMAVKDTRDKLGLTFTGKTMDGLVDAVKAHAIAEAKINPDERVKQLQTDLEKVRATATEFEGKVKTSQQQFEALQLQTDVATFIPSGTILPARKILGLMQMDGYDFKKEEGKIVAVKHGEIVKNKLSEAVPVKDIITEYLTENKFMGDEGGGGAAGGGGRGSAGPGGPTPPKITKLSQLRDKYIVEKKSDMSREFLDEAAALKKTDPTFDYDA